MAKWLVSQGGMAPAKGAISFNRHQTYYGSLPVIAVAKGNLAMLNWLDSTLHLPLDEPNTTQQTGKTMDGRQ